MAGVYLLGFIIPASCLAEAQAQDFTSRAARILELGARAKNTSGTVEQPKSNLYFAMARYATGKVTEANALVAEVMDNRGACAMFCALSAQLVYQWYGSLMPGSLQQKMKAYLLTQGATGGTTENHKIMYASSAFISSYTWPEAISKRSVAKAEIDRQVDIILNHGLGEDDSAIYIPFYLNSFILLYEFSPDPLIKQKARLALDFMMANGAPEFIGGVWAAATLRNVAPRVDPNSGTSVKHGYLYFGIPSTYNNVNAETIPQAISSYRLIHPVIVAATNRSKSFVHREMSRGAGQPAVSRGYKTTFMNRTYGIFSEYDGNAVSGWRDQYTRWGVVWPNGAFYLKDIYINNGGDTKYNQVMQLRGTVLGVAVEAMTKFEIGITRKFSRDGWDFMQGGEAAYIAYRSFGTGPRAWVVDTATRLAYPSLEAFAEAILAGTTIDAARAANAAPRLIYTTLSGDRLDIEYASDGSRTAAKHFVNGARVDYANWPLLDNPWMNGAPGAGLLTMKVKDVQWIYDRDRYTLTKVE
jgi:hypothetical protein